MKTPRIIALCLLLAGGLGLLALQRRYVSTEITPRPLLYLIADTERELERLPLELTRVSPQEEMRVGQELAREYGLTPARHTDPDVQRIAAYVQEVGDRLAAQVKRKQIRYRFHYKADPQLVNAGSLPGGQVVIGGGLLRLLRSEDELAAVLGHEMAHVDERHCIERLQYELKSRKLGVDEIYVLARIGVVLFESGYAKQQEEEADRAGLGLAVRAGYSAAGALDVMRRFGLLRGSAQRPATSPIEELAGIPVQSLQEYFRSHPPESERLATLEREIRARGYDAAQAQRPLGVRPIFLVEEAGALDRRGRFEQATARYHEALKSDPNYRRAWEGLANTSWRTGDIATTIQAAKEALQRNPDAKRMWRFLSRALAVENHQRASLRFAEAINQFPPTNSQTVAIVQAEALGLALTTGSADAVARYREMLERNLLVETDVALRRNMAWWMYRAGRLAEAVQELEDGRQKYPQTEEFYSDLAWVLTDQSRQADALEDLRKYRQGSGQEYDLALEALILWRTNREKEAQAIFQRAAEADPVWMVPKWVENNFSAAAAGVFARLQAEESARRAKTAKK